MARIEIHDRIAARLMERARARNLSVEQYLEGLLEQEPRPVPPDQLSVEELDRLLDELAEGLDHLPPLPKDFSRADIYLDHD